MRERVRHLNGVMDIQSNGTGAIISVTFPVAMVPATGTDGMLQSLEATG
jgi:signal transduction histidine kinase